MRASIQGGLWALLLSSTGLAFASVVDDNMRGLPAQIAAQTDVISPLNLVDVPTAAMASTPETSAVVASVAPLRIPPAAPVNKVSEFAPALPPKTLAQLDIVLGQPVEATSPMRPFQPVDAQVVFANVVAPTAPAGPFAPVIVTQPALPEPERTVIIQSRNTAPAGNLIVRVQATGNSGGGVVTRRLPQIAPPAPEGDDAVSEEVIETPAPEQAPEGGQAPAAPVNPEAAPATDAPDAESAPEPELPSFGDVTIIGIDEDGEVIEEQVLPSFGDARVNQLVPVEPIQPEADPDASAESDESVVEGAVDPADLPALERYAAPFDNPDNLPVVGIVLIDDGTFVNGPFLMFESGVKATIAVTATATDVNLFAEAYREAGMEIAMQVPLPVGATPTDVEVNFAAALEVLPEAAMLYASGDDGLRNNRQAAGQIVDILAADNHGFVTVSSGLGGPLRAAEAAGVTAGAIVRNLDDAEGNFDAMLRILDRAAFEARRGAGAIVSGTLTPETIAIIQAWSDDGVLVGPASAVMLQPDVAQPVTQRSLPQIEADETAQDTTAAVPQTQALERQEVITEEDE